VTIRAGTLPQFSAKLAGGSESPKF